MLWRDPDPRPRTWWGESWRITLALAVGALLWLLTVGDERSESLMREEWWALDAGLGVRASVLLPARRARPLPTALATAALTSLSVAAVPAAGITVVSLATHRRPRPLALVGAMWVGAGFAFEAARPLELGPKLVMSALVSLLVLGMATTTGYSIGAQRALQHSLTERLATAERAQASRLARARASERTRIAREMHDVLAHRMSIVAMHSGALSYRTGLPQAEWQRSAALIRDASHEALTQLREVLGVLRDTDPTDAPDHPVQEPQPTLADVVALVDRERVAGTRIVTDLEPGRPNDVPTTLSRHAYRIVQEILTNARKHAAGATLHLAVRGQPGARSWSRDATRPRNERERTCPSPG